ncbi:MAG: ADP-glyceromanno-heptose 6-epimerase [Alphaproteobacteria bacterium]|nr:ADP-glyceromanno-heptose 6-epimerase [Alphaproteobacteria bacterium]
MAAKIVVTGGAGFIGSNIAHRLADRGDADIIVCDRFGAAADEKWRNLAACAIADIIAPDTLIPYLDDHASDIAALVHMGAVSSTTEQDVDLIVETNIRLPQRLWRWATQRQRPFIYASSAATYGDGAQGFADDNTLEAVARLAPLNAYGWSKKAFDVFAVREARRGAAPPAWSGLRFFNVYGPREQHKGAQKSVVAHMHPRAVAGEPVTLFRSHNPRYPDGGQLRDFVYVRDCVDVVEWLLEGDRSAAIVNVGTGAARSFADLAGALFAALNRAPDIRYVDTPEDIRAKYQYYTQADMTRLRDLGYDRQFTTIENGVADYVAHWLGRS